MSRKIESVKGWELRKGKKELLRHLEGGKPLTAREAITAKCYDCMGGYPEGAFDCNVPECPLHEFTPYREGGPRRVRVLSQKTKDELIERNRQRLKKKTNKE